jgi:hypothetical protein
MRASYLKKRYPEEWARIEMAVKDDFLGFKKDRLGNITLTEKDVVRIAHNAAFFAILEVRDMDIASWKD